MPSESNDVHFPAGGLDLGCPFGKQTAREVLKGVYRRTCRVGVNVRGVEPGTKRLRGGARGGVGKLLPARVAGLLWVIQCLDSVVTASEVAMQTSQSGRVLNRLAVSYGQVFRFRPGDTAYTEMTNNTGETPALSVSGLVFSAANNQRLFFADGVNSVYCDPVTGTLQPWSATAGSRPIDSADNRPRLIANWRGRIVESGLPLDPQTVFATRVDDPFDNDYSPVDPDPQQAWALQTGNEGTVGDSVTCLAAYSDDILIIGCDHSIYMLRGDPGFGGTKDLVSEDLGIVFGKAWCKDPDGNFYFFSNRGAVYVMAPGGGKPTKLTQPINQLVNAVNTGENAISMAWDDKTDRLHVFVTPLLEPGATDHYCWERQTGAWWVDRFKNKNHNPLCVAVFDGNEPDDRVIALGCWDGFVRQLDPAAADDDGYAIESEVVIGPVNTKLGDEMYWSEMQGVFAEVSGRVAYSIYAGRTAESALGTTPFPTGAFGAGRSTTKRIARAGHAIYAKLSSTEQWAMESLRVITAPQGDVRQRGR